MSGDSSVFSRWSQRKRAVAAEAERDEVHDRALTRPDEGEGHIKTAPEQVDLTEEEVLERLGLPDPESLQQGDDFAAFLKDGVPEAIRNRALRRLWRSNPVLANLDGLIDHGEDYTDAAMVPETINTLYQVGKGMLRKVVQAPDAEGEAVVAEVAQATESDLFKTDPFASMTPDEAFDDAPGDLGKVGYTGDDDMKSSSEQTETEEETPFTPRRMAFRCD